MDWEITLTELADADPWYRECLEDLDRREPEYRALLHSLTDRQQEVLELYIAACEELEHARTLLAYELGRSRRQ